MNVVRGTMAREMNALIAVGQEFPVCQRNVELSLMDAWEQLTAVLARKRTGSRNIKYFLNNFSL